MEKQFATSTFATVTIPNEHMAAGDYAVVRRHSAVTMWQKKDGDPIVADAKNLTVWKKEAEGS